MVELVPSRCIAHCCVGRASCEYRAVSGESFLLPKMCGRAGKVVNPLEYVLAEV